ncbi:MAG: Zeta toxin family protein [Acidobacteria bacterium]|nr:MAG: Zeta toxin family protein [Acidobacteriota bacterium]
MPRLFVIGGPNGAGKTTSAMALMPELLECEEYVNADAIAQAISPFRPESVALQSGRLMLRKIHQLAVQNADFAFETTLASRSFAPLLSAWKGQGYAVTLLFLWLRSPQLAVDRVRLRVQSGGHAISDDVIIRRYWTGLKNLVSLYLPLADRWSVYDNSGPRPRLVAGRSESDVVVYDEGVWNQILKAGQ